MIERYILLFLLCYILYVNSLQNGDRISAMSMTLHDGWKTQYTDLSIHQMPRFRIRDSLIFHSLLPRPDPDGSQMDINLSQDIKISFTFSNNKLIVPMVILYDSINKKSLIQLTITFYHDDFSVQRVSYDTKYGTRSLDSSSHTSLTGFEIVYKWEGEQEDDLAIGITTMFVISLAAFLWIFCAVIKDFDNNEKSILKQANDRRNYNISSNKNKGFSSTKR